MSGIERGARQLSPPPLPRRGALSLLAVLRSAETRRGVSVSTHWGSTIVQGIVKNQPRRRREWRKSLTRKMEGLFGEGLWRTGEYEESAWRSHRYSLQLLPVDKGPTTKQAPWMEAMTARVQGVLIERASSRRVQP